MPTKAISTRNTDVISLIEQGRRDHFRNLLADMMDCVPSKAALKKAAAKNPASYFKSLKTVSELAGYHQGSQETTNNILVQVNHMSDSALQAELEAILNSATQQGILPPIDAEITEINT